jgi:hypothetical protein
MKMSQVERQSELREKTRQLLEGPLRHARVIGLAAALLPVAAVPAAADPGQPCGSAGNVCGFVWNDLDGDGVQDAGEPGIEGAVILVDGQPAGSTFGNGFFEINVPPGDHLVQVQIPNGSVPSPADQVDSDNPNPPDTVDSDGTLSGEFSVTPIFVPGDVFVTITNIDFGFIADSQVGTGTPGYWMNHPEAWHPDVIANGIVVGGVTYMQAQALAALKAPINKDKTYTMFASLVAAKLNVLNGTNAACISDTIEDADEWMATYGPVGRGVHASSYAWRKGEPLHRQMDNYNNGMLCAPHRD